MYEKQGETIYSDSLKLNHCLNLQLPAAHIYSKFRLIVSPQSLNLILHHIAFIVSFFKLNMELVLAEKQRKTHFLKHIQPILPQLQSFPEMSDDTYSVRLMQPSECVQ